MKITAIDTKKKGELALMRVAGYARVSVDTFNSAHSLEAQSAFLKKRITSTPGWVDGGVFIDLGITGTKTDRPGFHCKASEGSGGGGDVSDHVNQPVKISGLQQWFLSLYLPNECNKEGLEDE